ncbi:beta-microseminoprotein-like [Discoglossus pictus]
MKASIMDYILGFALALCMITLCDAQCQTIHKGKLGYVPQMHQLFNKEQKACVHDGVKRHIGEEWIEGCQKCYCHKNGITCCSVNSKPVFTTEGCYAVLDPISCKFIVINKNGLKEECISEGSIS